MTATELAAAAQIWRKGGFGCGVVRAVLVRGIIASSAVSAAAFYRVFFGHRYSRHCQL
ncbi:MAG: hypothetical protein HAW59_01450 [Betaproteobacteria bacterium]|nr:hypothetical protein [Betaproteobacteria bacterium]